MTGGQESVVAARGVSSHKAGPSRKVPTGNHSSSPVPEDYRNEDEDEDKDNDDEPEIMEGPRRNKRGHPKEDLEEVLDGEDSNPKKRQRLRYGKQSGLYLTQLYGSSLLTFTLVAVASASNTTSTRPGTSIPQTVTV